METSPFLPYLQQPAIWLYPKLQEYNLQPPIIFH